MTLLDLARQFDSLPEADHDGRIATAEQMKPLLGDRLEEFDRIHETKVAARHRLPAIGALADMGLIMCSLPARKVLDLLGHWRESDYEIALHRLGAGLLDSLRDIGAGPS